MHSSSRRTFISSVALTGTASILMASKPVSSMPKKQVVHHVFFWLKDPNSAADRDKLVEGVKNLSHIEVVREIHVGILAQTEKRDVVDQSWQVSELIFFDDLAGQSTYQSHPIHQDFIKNYGHLWQKVVVYDAMEV